MEDLILRKLVPHPDRLETSMAPMRLYQRSGLQKLVRKLGLLKMFPRPLERMEGLLPDSARQAAAPGDRGSDAGSRAQSAGRSASSWAAS